MSERLRSIVDGMNVRPDDEVLEIGCGHGVSASFVCERLKTGNLVAIDKSKKMIAASIRRNKEHIESGKAEFHVADVLRFDPGARKFDKILAVRNRSVSSRPSAGAQASPEVARSSRQSRRGLR